MSSRQAIQERSYFHWESEGRPQGRELEHWRRAEDEMLAELERLHMEAEAMAAAQSLPEPEAAPAPKAAKPKKRAGKRAKAVVAE